MYAEFNSTINSGKNDSRYFGDIVLGHVRHLLCDIFGVEVPLVLIPGGLQYSDAFAGLAKMVPRTVQDGNDLHELQYRLP